MSAVWILTYTMYAVTDIELHIRSWYRSSYCLHYAFREGRLTQLYFSSNQPIFVSSCHYASILIYTPSAVTFLADTATWSIILYSLFRYILVSFGDQLRNYAPALPVPYIPGLYHASILWFEAKLLAKKNQKDSWALKTRIFHYKRCSVWCTCCAWTMDKFLLHSCSFCAVIKAVCHYCIRRVVWRPVSCQQTSQSASSAPTIIERGPHSEIWIKHYESSRSTTLEYRIEKPLPSRWTPSCLAMLMP